MLTPALTTAAGSIELEHVPVAADQVVAGRPATGSVVLDALNGAEIGVWEMTPGAMSDVEVDEVFVVLSGAATVDFEGDGGDVGARTRSGSGAGAGAGAGHSIRLTPGEVVRLTAGMRTVWTVTETLRKLYVA